MNTVTFKFDIDETVYFFLHGEIMTAKIIGVYFYKHSDDYKGKLYGVRITEEKRIIDLQFPENEFFSSKAELIKHSESLNI